MFLVRAVAFGDGTFVAYIRCRNYRPGFSFQLNSPGTPTFLFFFPIPLEEEESMKNLLVNWMKPF